MRFLPAILLFITLSLSQIQAQKIYVSVRLPADSIEGAALYDSLMDGMRTGRYLACTFDTTYKSLSYDDLTWILAKLNVPWAQRTEEMEEKVMEADKEMMAFEPEEFLLEFRFYPESGELEPARIGAVAPGFDGHPPFMFKVYDVREETRHFWDPIRQKANRILRKRLEAGGRWDPPKTGITYYPPRIHSLIYDITDRPGRGFPNVQFHHISAGLVLKFMHGELATLNFRDENPKELFSNWYRSEFHTLDHTWGMAKDDTIRVEMKLGYPMSRHEPWQEPAWWNVYFYTEVTPVRVGITSNENKEVWFDWEEAMEKVPEMWILKLFLDERLFEKLGAEIKW
ncbi:MAG: hypothetical protein H6581_18935 [Bacteroidia bacterium]|nr:hypothetical protein [Bacteroidia bacterium]